MKQGFSEEKAFDIVIKRNDYKKIGKNQQKRLEQKKTSKASFTYIMRNTFFIFKSIYASYLD